MNNIFDHVTDFSLCLLAMVKFKRSQQSLSRRLQLLLWLTYSSMSPPSGNDNNYTNTLNACLRRQRLQHSLTCCRLLFYYGWSLVKFNCFIYCWEVLITVMHHTLLDHRVFVVSLSRESHVFPENQLFISSEKQLWVQLIQEAF